MKENYKLKTFGIGYLILNYNSQQEIKDSWHTHNFFNAITNTFLKKILIGWGNVFQNKNLKFIRKICLLEIFTIKSI